MITLFGINNCDTIKKTRKWLDLHDIDYEFHDYKKAGCPEELIGRFLTQFSHEELINTRGTTWRKLPESVRQSLDSSAAIRLMHQQPSLIRRPIINAGSDWLIGFDTQRMEQLLT